MSETPQGATPPDVPETVERSETRGLVRRLTAWVAKIRHLPKILYWMLGISVASSLALGWVWFLRHEPVWVKAVAVPWLALAAAPQLGLWLLAKTIEDVVLLPKRLVALGSELGERKAALLGRELDDTGEPRGGLVRRVRSALSLQGDVAQILGTRVVVQRLSGRFALFIGPVSIAANALIIVAALVQALVLLR